MIDKASENPYGRKLVLYLDTSVISFLCAEDSLERCAATRELFDNYIATGVYTVHISSIVVDKLSNTPNPALREQLISFITKYQLEILDTNERDDEIRRLAAAYVKSGIIPLTKFEDALHIAISTVFEIDILLSWNYRHLANVKKELLIQGANLSFGYTKPLKIVTPLEVLSDET